MNIIFFGTSEFAVPSLERIAQSKHKILAVVTQPDRKKGRFQQVAPPAVKEAGIKHKIDILQPQDLADPVFIEKLKSLKADLFVVVSYGNILKKEILEIPLKFCVNLHGSVLPKYRGAAPVNRAIINGDGATGVTVIKMNEKMDEGDIISKKEVQIYSYDTAASLFGRLSVEGSVLLIETIENIERGKAQFEKQDEKLATYAPKLKKEDGLINWDKEAASIENHIRGMQPWPGAYTYFNGKLIKICKVSIYGPAYSGFKPGEIIGIEKDGILVNTKTSAIVIEELQPESSRRMDVEAFLAGYRIKPGNFFENNA